MFTRTRLELTIIYTIVFMTISGAVSGVFYYRTAAILDEQFEVIEQRLQRERLGLIPRGAQGHMLQILPEDVQEAKEQIVVQLLAINGIVALLFAGAGYYLSGKTLEPLHLAMEEQKRFIADAAHELKTPLTALRTSMEVNLLDKKIARDSGEVLRENLEDVDRLQSLVEGLLVLNRQENNGIKKEQLSLGSIANKVIKQLSSLADNENIAIKMDIPESILLAADEISLERLFTVLIDNAIKYSGKGSEISVTAKEERGSIIITVKDNGSGIAKHHLPYIFERFYRVDSARSKNSGYGLGLSVAKTIVAQHEGKIVVESEVNNGTTFSITLPQKN